MSKGVFTLIDTFVGKAEAALIATDKLRNRLKEIHKKNIESGKFKNIVEARPKLSDVLETHTFFAKAIYKPYVAFAFEYFKKLASSGSSNAIVRGSKGKLKFNLHDNNGVFINDMVVRLVIEPLGDPNAPSTATRYRYCDFPGMRLFSEVSFKVDENPIDSYTSIDMVQFFRTRLASEKTKGFSDLVGQQSVKSGSYYNPDYNINQVLQFTDGPQTLRPYQPQLEIFVPIVFDFNLQVERSLHMGIITSQQVNIEIELERLEKIIQAQDSNGNILSTLNKVNIKQVELYTKNIYYPQEICDIFNMSSQFALFRMRRSQRTKVENNSDSILLHDLKYPIEFLNFAFRPDINDDVSNPNSFSDWHKLAFVRRTEFPVPVLINNPNTTPVQQLVARTATYETCVPVIKTASLKIHGNILYSDTTEKFYSSYLQWFFPNVNTVNDCGFYVVSFANDPNSINPNGHINNSTARELYLNYTSDMIENGQKVTLYVVAQCINMIVYDLLKDGTGTIRLKYIT